MRTAFVYYLEFTDNNTIYFSLLKESIKSLIKYNYCYGSDIFVNVIGYSGVVSWDGDRHVAESDILGIWYQLKSLADKYNINLIDISDDALHYVELPVIVDLPINQINNKNTFNVNETTRLKIFNHKFTSYPEIIKKGYDRIIQLDADLIFYSENDFLFETDEIQNPDVIHFCRLTNSPSIEYIKFIIDARSGNNTKLFNLINTKENRLSYLTAKKFIQGTINYNIDNFVNDIYNQGFWVSGGTGVFSKAFIEKHFRMLSFLNYFFSKDDEIVLMLYCFANNIQIKTLDPSGLICLSKPSFDIKTHVAFHPCGYTEKINLIANNFIINNNI